MIRRKVDFKSFANIATLYLGVILLLKLVELFFCEAGTESFLVRALTYNYIVASWTIVGLLLIFCLVSLFSKNVAKVVTIIIFSLLSLSEIGLTFYALHNGYLLDSELWVRPLDETLIAIRGAVGLVVPIVGVVVVVGGFVALGLWAATWKNKGHFVVWIWVSIFALLSLIFPVRHLRDMRHDTYILNKTHYLISDSWNYFRNHAKTERGTSKNVAYNETMMAELRHIFPDWEPEDPFYPLERKDSEKEMLNDFFMESSEKPNVVFIVVESLGAEFMGTGLMPFVDSLAQCGLYWRNCLSTTSRSYGAIPAITGSVGGPKSFQFGNMPQHNSLISILRNAGYSTQAFYSGYFTFDCIFEYLQAQKVDYMSPFYDEFGDKKNKNLGNWWGYHDGMLFRRTMEVLNEEQFPRPMFNLITTLTMHEKLDIGDSKMQAYCEQKSSKIIAELGKEELLDRGAACVYTDDCLRTFMAEYSKRPDFGTTIFVITGDHASGLEKGNKLAFHHVPLIIYSPLITQTGEFDYLVTHNDIAPSVCRLLGEKYGVEMPATVHWLGDGLSEGTKTMLIVNYNHEMQELLCGKYFYQTGNTWEGEAVYEVDEDLNMKELKDVDVLDSCRKKMAAMRYLYEYTYYNDKLTQHPVYAEKKYVKVRHYLHSGEVKCVTPDDKPSEKGAKEYMMMPLSVLKNTEGYDVARITLNADVTIVDSLWQDQYMELVFSFHNGRRLTQGDKISKFIESEVLRKDSVYHLEIEKEYTLQKGVENACAIYIRTPQYDDVWVPNTRLNVNNIEVEIEYGK